MKLAEITKPIARACSIRPLATAAAVCALALAGVASRASAEDVSTAPPDRPADRYTQVMLDANYAASGVNETGDGGGAALRVGRGFPLRYVTFVPELGAEFFAFSGTREAKVYGAYGGSRMRFGRVLEPGIFAHFGVDGVTRGDSHAAPTMDLGLTLDLTHFEHLMLGVQGMYKGAFGVAGNPSFSWYTAGLSVGYRT